MATRTRWCRTRTSPTLVDKLKTQKGIVIEQKVVHGANHFFDGKIEPLMTVGDAYLDKRLKVEPRESSFFAVEGQMQGWAGSGRSQPAG